MRGFLPALIVGRIDPTPSVDLSPVLKGWLARPPADDPRWHDRTFLYGEETGYGWLKAEDAIMQAMPSNLLDLSIQAHVAELGRYDACQFSRNLFAIRTNVRRFAECNGLPHPDTLRRRP